MSLSIDGYNKVIGLGCVTLFEAEGGVEPYVYSVADGGIGGTIDENGVYVAPEIAGVDTVVVTDAVGSTAQVQVCVFTALELVCDIVQKEMGLDNGRVYLYDQKINMPSDDALFIVVQVAGIQCYSNTRRQSASDGTMSEQVSRWMATLSIDIMSRGTEALYRKEEVVMALNSLYAEQQQELNSFKVFYIPQSMVPISQEDGAAIPYRFNISVNVSYSVTKTKAVDYFASFPLPTVATNA